MLAVNHLRKLTLTEPTHPDRLSHLSAASGLVCVGDIAYVVADDELHLGVFPLTGAEPGHLLPLFPGDLPLDARQRKKHKPDLESLALLPSSAGFPHGALLALGSASKPNRRRGALLPLNVDGSLASSLQLFQPDGWYDFLEARIGALNLEGAFVDGQHLVLLQRGNKSHRLNAIIRLSLAGFMASLTNDHLIPAALLDITEVALGEIDTVPLAFTDGVALANGDFVFSAVAENTNDSYNDGACLGAVIGVSSAAGKIKYCEQLASPWKVEGISATERDNGIDLLLVTDADDESIPAALLSASLPIEAHS